MRLEPIPRSPQGNVQIKLIIASTKAELEQAMNDFLTTLHGHDVTVTLADPTVTTGSAQTPVPGPHLAWVVYQEI